MKLLPMLMMVLLSIGFTSCSKENDEAIAQNKVLVVIAHEGESDYMPADDRIEVIYTGIGKLNAALKVSNYLKAQKEHNTNYIILNIGTCGSPNYPVGSLVIPKKIYQGDTFIEEDFKDHTSAYTNDILSLSFYKDALQADFVLSSDQFINTSSPFYQKFKDYNCLFEMEAYAIASVASDGKIPFYCIKVVSDNCDGTQKDWENVLSQIRPEVDKAISNFCKEMLH